MTQSKVVVVKKLLWQEDKVIHSFKVVAKHLLNAYSMPNTPEIKKATSLCNSGG